MVCYFNCGRVSIKETLCHFYFSISLKMCLVEWFLSWLLLIRFFLWFVLRTRVFLPISFALMSLFLLWSSGMFIVLSQASWWTLIKVSLSLLMGLFILIVITTRCHRGTIPFCYQCVPIFSSALNRYFFQPVVDRVNSKLASWKCICLSMMDMCSLLTMLSLVLCPTFFKFIND